MKVFTLIFTVVATIILAYNITMINWQAPFTGDSMTALIVCMLSLCALLMIWILYTSKQIAKKAKYKK